MHVTWEVVWFILPAGFANMAPIFAVRVFPKWNAPVDGGASLRGTRIFGDHKTIRGLVSGVLVGALVFFVQARLYAASETIRDVSILDYEHASIWLGSLMGFGALFGDLVKSFFKRRVGRKPGVTWFPFDQIDWVVGVLAVMYPIVRPGLAFVLVSLVASLVLSLIVKWIGFLVRLGDTPI
jgi:CDP-2,3-bis-(O-geranylgeranyl)-sn-glycerol synthase